MKFIKDTPKGTSETDYDVITKMEEEWPEMTKEFKKIQKEQYELFLYKQHDYGPGNISVGTFLVIQGSLSLGELIAFRIISGYVTGPLLRLSNLYQDFQQTNISIERVSDIINTPQESTEKDSLNIPMPKISGDIKFDNLSFSFLDSI